MRVFLLGCALTIPGGMLEYLTGAQITKTDLSYSVAVSFGLIAPIEEGMKLLAVWIGVYRASHFREPVDGLIYATTAALGFASVENVTHFAEFGSDAALLGKVTVLRMVFATPAHIMFACMWGYSMGLARVRADSEAWRIMKGFFLAVLLHGSYDSLVAVNPRAAVYTLVPLMVLMGWVLVRQVSKSRKSRPFARTGKGAVVTCPVCSVYTSAGRQFCERCGSEVRLPDTEPLMYCAGCRAVIHPGRDKCARCGELVGLVGSEAILERS